MKNTINQTNFIIVEYTDSPHLTVSSSFGLPTILLLLVSVQYSRVAVTLQQSVEMDSSDSDSPSISSLAQNNILLANELIGKLKSYSHIDGVKKIERQICQEIKFLQKVLFSVIEWVKSLSTFFLPQKLSSKQLTINHILGSNLAHYNFLITVLERTDQIQHTDYPVKVDGTPKSLVRIDIVCDTGATWIKVIARNSKAISNVVNGEASFGTKSIVDHARSYLHAAKENPCHYRPPKVRFIQLEVCTSVFSPKFLCRLYSISPIVFVTQLSVN